MSLYKFYWKIEKVKSIMLPFVILLIGVVLIIYLFPMNDSFMKTSKEIKTNVEIILQQDNSKKTQELGERVIANFNQKNFLVQKKNKQSFLQLLEIEENTYREFLDSVDDVQGEYYQLLADLKQEKEIFQYEENRGIPVFSLEVERVKRLTPIILGYNIFGMVSMYLCFSFLTRKKRNQIVYRTFPINPIKQYVLEYSWMILWYLLLPLGTVGVLMSIISGLEHYNIGSIPISMFNSLGNSMIELGQIWWISGIHSFFLTLAMVLWMDVFRLKVSDPIIVIGLYSFLGWIFSSINFSYQYWIPFSHFFLAHYFSSWNIQSISQSLGIILVLFVAALLLKIKCLFKNPL